MNEQKDKKSLDELISHTISGQVLEFDFNTWKKQHQHDIQKFKERTRARRVDTPIAVGVWRIIMKSRVTKLTAAAVITVFALVGLNKLGSSLKVTTPVYGITDVPELFRSVETLHVKGYLFSYDTDPNCPGFVEGKILPREVWVDVPNQRMRDITQSSYTIAATGKKHVDRVETVFANRFLMHLNHTKRWMYFNKLSPMRQKLKIRRRLDDYACLVSPEMLEGYSRVGQERIEGVEYDIWQCQTLKGPQGHDIKLKCWLSPTTGQIGKICRYFRLKQGNQDWLPLSVEEEIDRNNRIPDEVFEINIPDGYAKPFDNSTPETANFHGLGPSRLYLDGVVAGSCVCFTLDDRSVIVGWTSFINEDEDQKYLFEGLKPGDELPKLPAILEKLVFIPTVFVPGGLQEKSIYLGRHLAFTQKDGRFIEWGLYVPESKPQIVLPQYVYREFYRFIDRPHEPLKEGNPLNGTRLQPEEFDEFVLGAMAELSDDGKAPDGVTYETVLQLAEEIRASMNE